MILLSNYHQKELVIKKFGETLLLLLLREKEPLDEQSKAFANRVLLEPTIPIEIKLYVCKAYILRGDQKGFTYLMEAI